MSAAKDALDKISTPLLSGFDYRPVDDDPALRLSPEARKRVNDKIDSVQAARRRAMATAHNYVIGAASRETETP